MANDLKPLQTQTKTNKQKKNKAYGKRKKIEKKTDPNNIAAYLLK